MVKLNQIKDNPGAYKKRMRIGRGVGSGKGKTGGRGAKGQTSRSGVALKGFEGGQMPLHMRLPKRGFNPLKPKKINAVNLGRLQIAIEAGKLQTGAVVNAETLLAAGVIRRKKDGVRILAKGELKEKLDFEVLGASKAAQAAIEKLGGKLTIIAPKEVPEKSSSSEAEASA